MSASGDTNDPMASPTTARLLEGVPVTERRLDLAGVSTSLLEGGEGPAIVLLHGQGGFRALGAGDPAPRGSHRVLAPDLPGLGQSEVGAGRLDAPGLVAWLGDLIAQTCPEPPTVVGISLGGSWPPASRSCMAIGSTGSCWSTRAASARPAGSWRAGRAGLVQRAPEPGHVRPGHSLCGRGPRTHPERVGWPLGRVQRLRHGPNRTEEGARGRQSTATTDQHAADPV